jgi:hypothetical protein
MSYFQQIPWVIYPSLTDAVGENTAVTLTNILTRSAFLQEVVNNISMFYEYQVKEGETAEIIADKLYGDVNRAWIVLLFNQINNAFYEFPLITEQLHDLIESKYGQTIEDSQTTVHHYETKVTRTVYLNGMPQSSNVEIFTISAQQQNEQTGIAEPRPDLPTLGTDINGESTTESFGAGITITTSYVYHAVSNYDYELDENEKRRSIKLIDAAYVGNVESELRKLMRDGN